MHSKTVLSNNSNSAKQSSGWIGIVENADFFKCRRTLLLIRKMYTPPAQPRTNYAFFPSQKRFLMKLGKMESKCNLLPGWASSSYTLAFFNRTRRRNEVGRTCPLRGFWLRCCEKPSQFVREPNANYLSRRPGNCLHNNLHDLQCLLSSSVIIPRPKVVGGFFLAQHGWKPQGPLSLRGKGVTWHLRRSRSHWAKYLILQFSTGVGRYLWSCEGHSYKDVRKGLQFLWSNGFWSPQHVSPLRKSIMTKDVLNLKY